LTIFPSMLEGVFAASILKRARDSGKVAVVIHDIRASAKDAHHTVDDTPYGGGAGMVMKADVLADALSEVPRIEGRSEVILMAAQGEKFEQKVAHDLALLDQMILICGRYEGVDERFIELFVDREISVGDFIVTGGEIPAMAVSDAVVRLLPGVLGNAESLASETFANGLLEYPQYTRPPEYKGLKVPEVLLSGNHKEIDKWRLEESLRRTKERRPDLLKK